MFSSILYILSVISKRLGETMGLKKYYYLYYLGIFFTLLGSIIMALSFESLNMTQLFGYLCFSIGLTLGFIASVKYWGWLIKELLRG
ncbi:MAG: hypothetical protein WC556_00900 [Candidatus Methanoperedens sp.]